MKPFQKTVRKQKILIDAVNTTRGGAVQVVLSLIKNASGERRYEWFLAISEEINEQLDAKCRAGFAKILVFKGGRFLSKVLNALRLESTVKSLEPDLVYTIFGPAYWKTSKPHLQGFAHPLLIYSYRDWFNPSHKIESLKHLALNPLKKLFFPKSSYYSVETQKVKEKLSSELSISLDNIFVVRNSVSPFFQKEIVSKIQKTASKSHVLKILVPSAYYSHKNLEITPYVAAEMVKKNSRAFKFIFIIPEQGEGWKNISSVAEKLGVGDKLVTLGTLRHADMADQYRNCDLVFLPTLVEASTAVYPESFMARRPLVTSDKAFAKELCGKGAVYVDPRNPVEMAGKLLEVHSNSKLRNKLVQEGLRSLRENYPSPSMKWKSQLKVIETLLKRAAVN